MLFFLVSAFSVHAKLSVVSYCDVTLERCKTQDQALKLLEQKYMYDISVDYIYYFDITVPTKSMVHIALECASRQGEKEMYKTEIQAHLSDLSRSALEDYAKNVELNMGNFTFCLDTAVTAWGVADQIEEAFSTGIAEAPAVRIGSDIYYGSQTFTSLESFIKEHLGLSPSKTVAEYVTEPISKPFADVDEASEDIVNDVGGTTEEEILDDSQDIHDYSVEQPLFLHIMAQFWDWLQGLW